MNENVFVPDFDLGVFRYMVARYVKLLIRARWKKDQGFLTRDELLRWGLADIVDDQLPAWKLAAMAADALAFVNRDFIPLCGSGGVMETDDSTPVGRLVSNLAGFVPPDGGGPYHHGTLVTVTSRLKNNQPVNWDEVAAWELLRPIRKDLDSLPRPLRPAGHRPVRDSGDRAPENIFRRNGNGIEWIVQYDGPYPNIIGDTAGAMYIHYLLQRPGRDVPAFELAAIWDRYSQGGSRCAAAVGVTLSRSSDDGPVLDLQAHEQCREELIRIEEELEEATDNNDSGRVLRLKAERQNLAAAVAGAVRPGGRPTLVGNVHRRKVDRVTKAIRRTIGAITEKNSVLGTHLDSFVSTGAICRYAPEFPTKWEY